MIKLLSLWLAWRAIRLIVAIAVVIGAVALLANGRTGVVGRDDGALTKLRQATYPLEQQRQRAIERVFKP